MKLASSTLFDPIYNGKSAANGDPIEHTDQDTYFRDVTYFIERVKAMAEARGVDPVRQNLFICFRGTALTWYTTIRTEDQKRLGRLAKRGIQKKSFYIQFCTGNSAKQAWSIFDSTRNTNRIRVLRHESERVY